MLIAQSLAVIQLSKVREEPLIRIIGWQESTNLAQGLVITGSRL